MLNPYGRPTVPSKLHTDHGDDGDGAEKGIGRAPGALRRYLDNAKKAKEEVPVKKQENLDGDKLQPIEEDIEPEDDVQKKVEPKEEKKPVKVEKVDKSVEVVTPERPRYVLSSGEASNDS